LWAGVRIRADPVSEVQALDFARLSADRLGGDVQKCLDESVMAQDITDTDWDQSELGGEG